MSSSVSGSSARRGLSSRPGFSSGAKRFSAASWRATASGPAVSASTRQARPTLGWAAIVLEQGAEPGRDLVGPLLLAVVGFLRPGGR